jgi:hypothetical protein
VLAGPMRGGRIVDERAAHRRQQRQHDCRRDPAKVREPPTSWQTCVHGAAVWPTPCTRATFL